MRTFSSWYRAHTTSLEGKTVALTGSTGGLGIPLCRVLAALDARLILIDRDIKKQTAHITRLRAEFPSLTVVGLQADLANFSSVKAVTEQLLADPPDILIHNAGAYSIPRITCDTGFDNVFQINFMSPYYMIRRLLPSLEARNGRVVAVGSIAHTYSVTDPDSVDFADRRAASKVYGNAKRYLMAAVAALIEPHPRVAFSIVHPGISFTGITAHYPPWLFTLIKHPMKIIFMKPHNAVRSLVLGLFDSCKEDEWIGPCLFDVWGAPKKKRLRTIPEEECVAIADTADALYRQLTDR